MLTDPLADARHEQQPPAFVMSSLLSRSAALSSGVSFVSGTSFLECAYGEQPLDDEHVKRSVVGVAVPPTTEKEMRLAKTIFALLKAYIGPGVLYLPGAWRSGGLLFATLMLPILGVLTSFCVFQLLSCRNAAGESSPSYGMLMEMAVGPMGRRAVNFSIVALQSGICITYFIFIAQILKQVWLHDWSPLPLIAVQLSVLIPLAWIRQVRRFAVTSLIADVLILAAIIAIYGMEIQRVSDSSHAGFPEEDSSIMSMLVCVGTQIFCFEGIALVLPIYDAVRDKKRFPLVFSGCLAVVCAVYMLSGLLGYLAFGEQSNAIVLLNLPFSALATGIQIAYAAAVVFTFPLQLLPATRVIEGAIFGDRPPSVTLGQKASKSLFRACFVVVLAVVALLGQTSFEHFVSLIGAFCGIPLAIVFPCICHYTLTRGRWQKAIDVFLAIFGVVLTFTVAIVNIMKWAGF